VNADLRFTWPISLMRATSGDETAHMTHDLVVVQALQQKLVRLFGILVEQPMATSVDEPMGR
jgi:hypothetical protein